MNCSICGAPLPPDGICRNPHPRHSSGTTPPMPSAPGLFRKPYAAAAWFAPVSVLIFLAIHLIHNVLTAIISNLLITPGTPENDYTPTFNYTLSTPLNAVLNLIGLCLMFLFAFLLFRAAAKRWDPTVRRGHISMIFVPFVIWRIAVSLAGSLNNIIYNAKMRDWERGKTSIGSVATVNTLLSFVLPILFAIFAGVIAFFVCRTLLKRLDRAQETGLPPLPVRPGGSRLPMKNAAWFAPVSIVVMWLLSAGYTLLGVIFPIIFKDLEFYERQVYQSLINFSYSILNYGLIIGICLLLYLLAANRWGKTRRGAHRAVAFLPYAISALFGAFSGIWTGLVSGISIDASHTGSSAFVWSGILQFVIQIVVQLIAVGVSVPIAFSFLKKAEAADDRLPVDRTAGVPGGQIGAPGAQPVYAPQNAYVPGSAYAPTQPAPYAAPTQQYGNPASYAPFTPSAEPPQAVNPWAGPAPGGAGDTPEG